MRAIIFGINGQDGHYLKQILEKQGIEVIGVSRSDGPWIRGNVGNTEFVQNLIKSILPQYIFHFAAVSTTKHEVVFENHCAITIGTLNVLESVRKYSPRTKVFISGSAVQFKNSNTPIDEQAPFNASSPYAVARIQSVYEARYYISLGLSVYIGYFFHHDSPLRRDSHLVKRIINFVMQIKDGASHRLRIGDLSAKMEFNFAGDIMEAVWLIVNQEQYSEVVIGSGKTISVKDLLEACFSYANLDWAKHVEVDSEFQVGYDIFVSNPKRLLSIGWQSKTDFKELIHLMFNEK